MKTARKKKSKAGIRKPTFRSNHIPEKYAEKRPWGNFEQFNLNEPCTVKIIHVNPHSKLSLQYHNHRREFWRILEGGAMIEIDHKSHLAKKGDEFTIPELIHHRISTSEQSAEILEIAYGVFDENDIVRLEDKYNRVDADHSKNAGTE